MTTPGRWLKAARNGWLLVASGSTALFISVLGPLWREATSYAGHIEYFGAPGHYSLSGGELVALQDLGLTAAWHGAFVLARHVVLFAGSLLVAWIIWRSHRGWAAVFVSWFLVTMFHVTTFTPERFTDVGAVFTGLYVLGSVAAFVAFAGLTYVLPDGRHIRAFGRVLGLTAVLGISISLISGDGEWLWYGGFISILSVVILGLVLQIARFVRSKDPTYRSVAVLTAVFVLTFVTVMFFGDSLIGIGARRFGLLSLVRKLAVESVMFALPLMFGIGLVYLIVKRGLWDVEFALNRTVIYGMLTTILFSVYFFLVAVVQAVASRSFGITDNTLAVVAATGVAAGLFLPIRERLQRAVDRIFFRKRYDVERTVESFERRIGERDRLGAVGHDLANAAEDAFDPVLAELWLPALPAGGAG